MNTCPLTISNLTADDVDRTFSIRSSGSTTASGGIGFSGANEDCLKPTETDNASGVMADGSDRSGSSNPALAASDGALLSSGLQNNNNAGPRRASLDAPSWPVETPGLTRWAYKASPPGSPQLRSHDVATMNNEDGPQMLEDLGNDATQIQQQPQDIQELQSEHELQLQKSLHEHSQQQQRASSGGNSTSSSIYLPVRHHHNHRSSHNESGDGIISIPTKRESEPISHQSMPRVTPRHSFIHSHSLASSACSTPAQAGHASHDRARVSAPTSFPTPLRRYSRRRSSFNTPLHPLHATIVFVDLEGYSKSSDVHQRQLTCDFMNTLRNLLTFAYGEMPVRGNIDNYVILPTGDGAAVIVIRPPMRVVGVDDGLVESGFGDPCEQRCESNGDAPSSAEKKDVGLESNNGCSHHGSNNNNTSKKEKSQQLPLGISCEHCNSQSLRTTEETALWIGSSLLLWASHRQIGLRVGLNSGELSIVEDPYGDPNVCGDAINMAARIMDTALPGQILASASTVIPNLNVLMADDLAALDLLGSLYDNDDASVDELDAHHHRLYNKQRATRRDCTHCPQIQCEIAEKSSEVVVKHGVTTSVQSITCSLHVLPRPEDLPPEFQAEPITRASTDSGTSPGGSASTDLLLHPMARMRKNPMKQSFASLSSIQPAGSNSSLRGSFLKGSNSSLRGSLTRGSSTSSNKNKRNSSWKLTEEPKAQTRMSMLSQLSTDEINASTKTLAHSNASQSHNHHHHNQLANMPHRVGNHRTPATKWYMKIKPTEMQSSSNNQIKPKVLPQELIRRHKKIAFLGIMHDNLSKGFIKILENDPSHRWDQVYILFPSDGCLRESLAKNYKDQPVEKLILNKQECRKTLMKLLSPVVHDLRFLQYHQLMHCGSYWDWEDPGGFIHISPVTWGANPKTCPAMNYYWNSKVPSPEYRVYRDGLEYLLGNALPFEKRVSDSIFCDTIGEEEG